MRRLDHTVRPDKRLHRAVVSSSPRQSACASFRHFPASPWISPAAKFGRNKGRPTDRICALLMTVAVWTLFAVIAQFYQSQSAAIQPDLQTDWPTGSSRHDFDQGSAPATVGRSRLPPSYTWQTSAPRRMSPITTLAGVPFSNSEGFVK